MKPILFKAMVYAAAMGAALMPVMARAADAEVEALLSKMRNAYQHVKSATFTTRSQAGQREFDTKVAFLGPNKMRLALSLTLMPKAGILLTKISNGKTVSSKEVQQPFKDVPFTADALAQDLPVNLESICFFDSARQLSTAPGKNMEHSTFKIMRDQTWNGKNWTILQETATDQKVVCEYYVDPHTNLIWRTTVKAMPGGQPNNNMDCKIIEMNLGAKIDPSTFEVVKL